MLTRFRGLLSVLGRARARVQAGLTIALLAVVYVLVMPWFAVLRRLRAPTSGWRRRTDPEVASMDRLRRLF